jgi:hypothetical protein
MPEDARAGIVQAVRDGEVQFSDVEFRTKGMLILEAAIAMAMADDEIAPAEQELLEQLGKKLGYTKADLNMMQKRVEMKRREQKQREKLGSNENPRQ